MKHKNKIQKQFIATFGLFLIFAFCKQETTQIQKQPIEEVIARVQFIKGEVFLQRNDEVKPLNVNDSLVMNDIIITKDNSLVDIIIKNKGIVRLAENTKIHIQTLTNESIELHQDSGTVITHLKRLKQTENYTIITPTSIAAVRGTSFITKVLQDKSTNYALIEGKIEIKNDKGKSIVMDQPGELVVQKQMDLTKQKVRPLSKESLQILKEIAAQETGNIQEFASFVQELKNSSAFKNLEVDSDYEQKVQNAMNKQDRKTIEKVKSGEETVIKRNIKTDPLKIAPEKDFAKN